MQCVVITANYRHAPEHPYPAAADDAFAGLKWAIDPKNAKDMSIDVSRAAVGGLSA